MVFGRAGRMSGFDISQYGVYEAARQVRFQGRDVHILLVDFEADARDHRTERPILERWLSGCDPTSAHFHSGGLGPPTS